MADNGLAISPDVQAQMAAHASNRVSALDQLAEVSRKKCEDDAEAGAMLSIGDDMNKADKRCNGWISEWEVMDSQEIAQDQRSTSLTEPSSSGGHGLGSVEARESLNVATVSVASGVGCTTKDEEAAADVWDAVMTSVMAGVVGSQEEDLKVGCTWMAGLTSSFRISPKRQAWRRNSQVASSSHLLVPSTDMEKAGQEAGQEGKEDQVGGGKEARIGISSVEMAEPVSEEVAASVLSKMHCRGQGAKNSKRPLLCRLPAGPARHLGIPGGSGSAFDWTPNKAEEEEVEEEEEEDEALFFSPTMSPEPSHPDPPPHQTPTSSSPTATPSPKPNRTAKQKLADDDKLQLPPIPYNPTENHRHAHRRKRRNTGLHPKPSPTSLSPGSFQIRFDPNNSDLFPRPSGSPSSPSSPSSPTSTFSLTLLHSPSPSPSGACCSGPTDFGGKNRKRPRSILKQTPSPTQCLECQQLRPQAGRAVKHSRKQTELAKTTAEDLLLQVQVLRRLMETTLESFKSINLVVPTEIQEQIFEALATAKKEESLGEESVQKLIRDSNVFCRMAGPEPKKIVFADEVGGSLCHLREFSSQEEGTRS